MNRQIVKIVLIVIAITMITVGCGTNATQSTLTPAPTATTAPSFPIGTLVKGHWTWEINADGSYKSKSELAEENGIYNVIGNKFSIMGDYFSCLGIAGIYTWTVDGNMLILTPVDDQCTNRRDEVAGKWRVEP